MGEERGRTDRGRQSDQERHLHLLRSPSNTRQLIDGRSLRPATEAHRRSPSGVKKEMTNEVIVLQLVFGSVGSAGSFFVLFQHMQEFVNDSSRLRSRSFGSEMFDTQNARC